MTAPAKPDMGERWHFDPASYSEGDPIFISSRRGWSGHNVRRYSVVKVTPSGQVVAKLNDAVVRITKRCVIAGGDRFDCVVSASEAGRIYAAMRTDRIWWNIRTAGAAIEQAGRKQDEDALKDAMAELASAIEAQRAETGTGSVEDESAVGKAETPEGGSHA